MLCRSNPTVGSNPTSSVVAVVQMVEQRVVIPHVVGSTPISHPLVCSTTVVQAAVNRQVTGSNPVRPVYGEQFP